MRFSKKIDWFGMWFEDRMSILDTMMRNLAADLDAGYNPMGAAVTKQKNEIENCRRNFYDTMDQFRLMTEEETQHYCFYDLKKRGAIA